MKAFLPTNILLPKKEADLSKWATVACDQYTSQPEYWHEVEELVKDAPSTLRLMLPEVWLGEAEQRIPGVHANMKQYITDGILREAVTNGFILTERTTEAGARRGLVGAVDLEAYSFEKNAGALVRPTEETIRSRLPARMVIRQDAPLELTHILILVDDPDDKLIGTLYNKRNELESLYDTDLMQGGGHIKGWAVDAEADLAAVNAALEALPTLQGNDPLLMAVGDGNHSLATAKVCWEKIKESLSEEEIAIHPARYALCEVVNIYDEALLFEPIHRILVNADSKALFDGWKKWCDAEGMMLAEGEGEKTFIAVTSEGEKTLTINGSSDELTAQPLQKYLDFFLKEHPETEIDYIHGDDVVRTLAAQEGTVGFLLPAIDKSTFFDFIKKNGNMPRKTFSLGEANEKRYYMEARAIKPNITD